MLDTPFPRSTAPRSPALARALLVLACALLAPAVAHAQWPSPTTGLPICTAAGSQSYRMAISDGAGGMFVAWSDTRFVLADIYVQHVSAGGSNLWAGNGAIVCSASSRQDQPVLVSDGAGGVVIAWRDFRMDTEGDIYAQRVNSNGATVWPYNGVAVCTATAQQNMPVIAADSAGGVVIAWEDYRDSPRVYAQRLDASGTPLWAANGTPVTTSLAAQYEPVIVTGGAFGTVLAWSQRGLADYDIEAEFLGHDGQPLWDPAGVPVCTATGDQFHPIAVSDSAGGAWFAWEDVRGRSIGVYAQRVTLTGFTVLAYGGLPVCTVDADQTAPVAVADGRGGMIVGWQDARLKDDVYAQRLDATGARLWPATGAVVCNVYGSHSFPAIAGDGRGGAMLVWEDERTGQGTDIYAQRLDSLGVQAWTVGGLGACTASFNQFQPYVVSSPDTVGIVAWVDLRGSNDLYCERIPFTTTAPSNSVALMASPNPASRQVTFAFADPQTGRALLTIYDASGRRVRTLEHTALAGGAPQIRWDARDDSGRTCAEGVYFARLAVDGRAVASRSITIVR